MDDETLWVIPNYPKYRINPKGDIFNQKGELMAVREDISGFPRVSLTNLNGVKSLKVADLIVQAFILTDPRKQVMVYYLDNDRSNVRADNLRVVTGYKPVRASETGEIWEDVFACAEALGVDVDDVYAAIRRNVATLKGLTLDNVF